MTDLLRGIQAIDSRAILLPFDVVAKPLRKRDLDVVRRQVVATTGDLIAMELHANLADGTAAVSTSLADLLIASSSWMRAMPSFAGRELDKYVDEGHALADDLATAQFQSSEAQGFGASPECGFVIHLGHFVRNWCDLLLAMRSIEVGPSSSQHLSEVAANAKPVRSIDYLKAMLDLMPIVLSMTVTSVIWYLTAWEDGPTALLFSFAGCVLVLGQAQILETTGGFLACVLIAFGLVFFYQFVVLPRVTDFVPLLIVLGCALIPLGLLMAMNMAGMLIAALTFSFLGLQNAYAADFSQSLQTLIGSLVGLFIAVISLRVCAYDHSRFTARRLAVAIRQDVLDVASAHRLPDRERFRFLALYRLSLYFSSIQQRPGDASRTRQVLNDLVVGRSILALREARTGASPAMRDVIGGLCRKTASIYRKKFARRGDNRELTTLVEGALAEPALRSDPAHEVLLDALLNFAVAVGARQRPPDREHAVS